MIYVANPDYIIVEPLKSIRIVSNGIDYAVMNENSVICSYKSIESAKQSVNGLIKLYQPLIFANSYCYSDDLKLLKNQFKNVIRTSGSAEIETLGNDFIYVFPSEEEL